MKKKSARFEKALIICNGESPGRKPVQKLARHSDLIVAADGGANVALSLGIRPDVIIGDLDSITKQTARFFSTSRLIHVSRQDNTDLEKALDFLRGIETKKVAIVAATGKRLDHTLGNLSVIWNYTSSIEIRFVGDAWYAVPIDNRRTFHASTGTIISLLPFGACAGITLRGLRYPLTNASMKVGEIGVSNVVEKSPFSVDVKKGRVLMIVTSTKKTMELPDSW
ncbi:thiamine diphosphokinase [Sphingobacteriales bacterium CHB3]|nr:thiamine diphosphokinase [Sphingobacteriales bacterium CHB3]